MSARRALIIQHEHDGPAGLAADHLTARGYELTVLQVMDEGSTYSDISYPDPTAFDVVVPLGSVNGVYEHDVIGSWIHRELAMLGQAHEAGVPMFGICFGAQSIAAALGGTVEKAPGYEIGWFTYETELPDVIGPGPWFTWHGDRFNLPAGAVELARTEMCTQAFRCGRSAGVQFHPEVTRDLVAGWAAKCPPQYFADRGVSADEIIAGFDANAVRAAQQAATLFDWFLDDVAVS